MANPETDVTHFSVRRQKAGLSQFAEKHHVSHYWLLAANSRTAQNGANRNCRCSRAGL
jgi:hypothetical protein